MAQLNYTPARVEVKLTSRGKYQWSIELPLTPDLAHNTHTSVVDELKRIDQKLREAFPMNAAEVKSSSRFSPLDNLDD